MKKPALKKARLTSIALRHLTIRPRFENEVRNKLSGITTDQNLVNQIIDNLKQNKFLDDKSLALSTAHYLLEEKNKGPLYIKHKLHHLGVDKDLISIALESISPIKQRQTIKNIINKRFKNKNQIIRLLNSRGFSWQQIYPFIDEIAQIE